MGIKSTRTLDPSLVFALLLVLKLTIQPALGQDFSNSIDGREYKVHLPKDYHDNDGRREIIQYPLVILLHGYRASGYMQDIYLGLSRQVSKRNFILAIPNGTKDRNGHRFWNATPACCDFYGSGVDDVGHLSRLIDNMVRDYAVDEGKVFIFGHSNGAFMASRLACEIPEKLAGILTIGGTGYMKEEDCKNPGPMKVLHVHGTDDETILFEGKADRYPGAMEMIGRWLGINQCDSSAVSTKYLDLAYVAGKETEKLEWKNCQDDQKVALLKMKGVGHIPWFKSAFLDEVFLFFK